MHNPHLPLATASEPVVEVRQLVQPAMVPAQPLGTPVGPVGIQPQVAKLLDRPNERTAKEAPTRDSIASVGVPADTEVPRAGGGEPSPSLGPRGLRRRIGGALDLARRVGRHVLTSVHAGTPAHTSTEDTRAAPTEQPDAGHRTATFELNPTLDAMRDAWAGTEPARSAREAAEPPSRRMVSEGASVMDGMEWPTAAEMEWDGAKSASPVCDAMDARRTPKGPA